MATSKCFFIGIFLFFYVFQHYTYAQSFQSKKAEKFSKRYAAYEMEDFLKFLNQSNDSSDTKQAITFLETCESELSDVRCISYRVPIGEPPYLLSERNWVTPEHTVLFYFHLNDISTTKAFLEDNNGNRIDPSILGINTTSTSIYPSFTIRGEEVSLDRATLGMFFIALKAIRDRFNRPRYNIRILIDTHSNRDLEQIRELAKEYGDNLNADLIFVFNGARSGIVEPALGIPSASSSSERIETLKENLNNLYGRSVKELVLHMDQTETIKYLSENFGVPIISIPIYEEQAIEKNELTFSQFAEGIKTFITVLQTRF